MLAEHIRRTRLNIYITDNMKLYLYNYVPKNKYIMKSVYEYHASLVCEPVNNSDAVPEICKCT
jgi:hypothetical protein